MVDLVKQDMTHLWAQTGDIVAPDDTKIDTGWAVETVPRQWWNWMQNRVDNNVAYVLQKSIAEWDSGTEYIINKSYVQHLDVIYKCIQTGKGFAPTSSPLYWKKALVESTVAMEALKSVAPATDRLPYFTSGTAATVTPLTAFARTILDDTTAVAVRTTIGAQTLDATLTAVAGVTTATNSLIYFTGVDVAAATTLSAFGRTLIDDADAAGARATLGLGTSATVNAATANTASTVVQRDASGNFAAGTITAALTGSVTGAVTGNASTATALQTARTINGVSFNGTANITVADSTKLPLAGGTLTGALNITAPLKSLAITTAGIERGFIEADTYGIRIRSRTSDGSAVAGTITLGVDGQTSLQGDLYVSQDARVAGSLNVTGTTTAPTFNATSTTEGGFQGIYGDTALAPSFTWTTDLNTGMWLSAADSIGFTCGGVNRATINSAGISGAGAGITGLNGTNITTGTVAAARVATLNQNTTGNAATATSLANIPTTFSGTYPLTVNVLGVLYSHTNVTFTGTSGVLAAPTFNATSITGGGFQGIDADTAAAPSFTWTSDLDTGIWRNAVDSIGFTCAGVNRITINAAGITGAGAGLTGLNASNLASGTLPDARLSGTYTGVNITGNAATATTLTSLTSTVAELNFCDGVTSNIQTQLNTKAPTASPTLTGTPLAPTAAVATNNTQIATTAFVKTAIAAESGPGIATAWVNFNGTGTVAIRDSHNVSSITDNGTGNYTINFATAMANTDYAFTGSAKKDDTAALLYIGQKSTSAKTTSAFQIFTQRDDPSLFDSSAVHVIIFGGK